MTIFFCVSGGPYGLEPLVGSSGVFMALALLVITTIVWAAPSALMTAELAAAIPEEGGYTVWVKRALGPFPGFLCGWWTWVYSWVDVAIYPVLFTTYLSVLLKTFGYDLALDGHPWLKWGIGMAMIVPFTALNVLGIKLVGRTAVLFAVALLLPFALLVCVGLPRAHGLAVPSSAEVVPALSAGLFVAMWNFLGWDSMSTVAAEVKEPQREFPRALLFSMLIIVGCYFLPVLIGGLAVPDPKMWVEGSWPTIARSVGGRWLEILVAVMALVSAAGLFMATLLSASRIPFVLSDDRYLPSGLTRIHPRFGTPWVAILVSAFFYSVLSFDSFGELLKIDVIIYSAGIVLEFAALVVLRRREPDLARPFRIPGGLVVVGLVALLPTAVIVFAVVGNVKEEGWRTAEIAVGALLTGPVVYGVSRWQGRAI